MDAVFDFDYIKYNMAAAAEKRSIHVVEKKFGIEYTFNNRTEFWGRGKKHYGGWLGQWNAENPDKPLIVDDFIITDVQTPEPLPFALNSVKQHIQHAVEMMGVDKYYGYIGKGDSWRVGASTILRYKGSRVDNIKPIHLEAIEEYLLKYHGAQLITHLEADDVCVIDTYKRKDRYLVGVDKDYMGCDVTTYHPFKQEFSYNGGFGKLWIETKVDISGKKINTVRGKGRLWFYFQVLCGDDSDCYAANSASDLKWGQMKAYDLLSSCKDDKEAWQAMWNGYNILYPEKKVVEGWRGDLTEVDALYMLQENATMAHMLRWEGDKLDVKGVLEKYGAI